MKRVTPCERRHDERFPQSLEVTLRELPDADSTEDFESATVSGRILNISQKGVCLITSTPVKRSAILRCEIPICGSQPTVATLMRVRWTRKQDFSPDSFVSGLEALL
jgi:hypothetical protein